MEQRAEAEHGSLDQAWQRVVQDLQPHQQAWLRDSEPVTLHESTAIIAVPNEFTRSQLGGRLHVVQIVAVHVIEVARRVEPMLHHQPLEGEPVLAEVGLLDAPRRPFGRR